MGNVKDELKKMEADKWAENNGIVMRTILAVFNRGYFKLKELTQTLSAYNISYNNVLDAIDYFDDLKYIEIKDETNRITHTYDEENIDCLKFRVTATGTRLGYGKIEDDGIDL